MASVAEAFSERVVCDVLNVGDDARSPATVWDATGSKIEAVNVGRVVSTMSEVPTPFITMLSLSFAVITHVPSEGNARSQLPLPAVSVVIVQVTVSEPFVAVTVTGVLPARPVRVTV